MRRRAALMVVAIACAGLGAGCMETPFAEVLDTVPASEFVQVDGQWVHYERAGSGPSLLLIHGFGESTYTWRLVMPELATDYDVIAVDLNGFGYTERPMDAGRYSLAGQVSLVKRFMDSLGISEAVVVGHSYGAGVAMGLATRHAGMVDRLVLVDGGVIENAATGYPVAPVLQPLLTGYVQIFLLTDSNVRSLLQFAIVDDRIITDDMVDEYLARVLVEGVDRTVRGLTSPAQDVLTLDPASILQPTLLVWGTEDPVIPLSVGEELSRTMPNSTLVTFPATGHLPMEEKPAELLAAFRAFLDATAP